MLHGLGYLQSDQASIVGEAVMGVNPADDKKPSAEASAEQGSQQASRRRMLRRSLGVAAPAVLTLVSNPVSACTCANASTFASQLAMSSRVPASLACSGGKTPTDWKNLACTSWPSGCQRSGTKDGSKTLYEVFGSDCPLTFWDPNLSTATSPLNTMATLKDALKCASLVARDIAAAYIGASNNGYVTSKGTVLSPSEVRTIWRSLSMSTKRYTPPGTQLSWDATTTQNWLKTMQV